MVHRQVEGTRVETTETGERDESSTFRAFEPRSGVVNPRPNQYT